MTTESDGEVKARKGDWQAEVGGAASAAAAVGRSREKQRERVLEFPRLGVEAIMTDG